MFDVHGIQVHGPWSLVYGSRIRRFQPLDSRPSHPSTLDVGRSMFDVRCWAVFRPVTLPNLRKLLLASAPGIALLWVLWGLLLTPRFLEELELRLFDFRQRLQGVDATRRDDILVVNIDEATISALDWPVPRNIWAAWLAALQEFEPRQVGFDVFMTHHLCDAYHDTLLSEIIATGPVVLGLGLSIPEDQETGGALAPEPATLPQPWRPVAQSPMA